jgi:2-polyprenyl-3-methyl-5-hydroxy-6-metoxy-1,4-benzoquinol methylase
VVNLDQEDLPFPDRHFDTVVCTDVLEHLERCHGVFDELCRVARGHVIVSLPNPLRVLLASLLEGTGGRIKYYGLPGEAPADRHRWFFGREEAVEFVTTRARHNGFEVEQTDAEDEPRPAWVRNGRDVLDHPNVAGGTVWFVLRRIAE